MFRLWFGYGVGDVAIAVEVARIETVRLHAQSDDSVSLYLLNCIRLWDNSERWYFGKSRQAWGGRGYYTQSPYSAGGYIHRL